VFHARGGYNSCWHHAVVLDICSPFTGAFGAYTVALNIISIVGSAAIIVLILVTGKCNHSNAPVTAILVIQVLGTLRCFVGAIAQTARLSNSEKEQNVENYSGSLMPPVVLSSVQLIWFGTGCIGTTIERNQTNSQLKRADVGKTVKTRISEELDV